MLALINFYCTRYIDCVHEDIRRALDLDGSSSIWSIVTRAKTDGLLRDASVFSVVRAVMDTFEVASQYWADLWAAGGDYHAQLQKYIVADAMRPTKMSGDATTYSALTNHGFTEKEVSTNPRCARA
jgi:hypothetical protein